MDRKALIRTGRWCWIPRLFSRRCWPSARRTGSGTDRRRVRRGDHGDRFRGGGDSARARLGKDARPRLNEFLREAEAEILPFGPAHVDSAVNIPGTEKARHPASLNFGDCSTYAAAAVSAAPLLFTGNDFGEDRYGRGIMRRQGRRGIFAGYSVLREIAGDGGMGISGPAQS